jgi:hypothetical protein
MGDNGDDKEKDRTRRHRRRDVGTRNDAERERGGRSTSERKNKHKEDGKRRSKGETGGGEKASGRHHSRSSKGADISHNDGDDNKQERKRDGRRSGGDDHRKKEEEEEESRKDKSRKRDEHRHGNKRHHRHRSSRQDDDDYDDDDDHRKKKRHKKEKSSSDGRERDDVPKTRAGADDRRSSGSKSHGRDKSSQRSKEEKPPPKSLVDLGSVRGRPLSPAQWLDEDNDYYRYHEQFWVYLFRNERVAFNDLDSNDEAKQAFKRFVEKYNAGQLEDAFYDASGTMPLEAVAESKTTRHAWGFATTTNSEDAAAPRLTKAEMDQLRQVQKGVRQQTEFRGDNVKPSRS